MEKNVWVRNGMILTKGDQKLNIGDEIYYKAKGTKYKGKWRLLGVDDKGRLLIVSEENVATLQLEGRSAYEQGETLLNKICAAYGKGKGATGARSITVEDINKITGYEPFKADEAIISWNSIGDPKCMYTWSRERDMAYHGSEFIWYNNEAEEWIETEKPKSLSYTQIARLISNKYSYSLANVNRHKIPREALNVLKFFGEGYWLASRVVCVGSAYVGFGMRLVVNDRGQGVSYKHTFTSGGYCSRYISGVRAVVTLEEEFSPRNKRRIKFFNKQ